LGRCSFGSSRFGHFFLRQVELSTSFVLRLQENRAGLGRLLNETIIRWNAGLVYGHELDQSGGKHFVGPEDCPQDMPFQGA